MQDIDEEENENHGENGNKTSNSKEDAIAID
jgi:hypothetical protein